MAGDENLSEICGDGSKIRAEVWIWSSASSLERRVRDKNCGALALAAISLVLSGCGGTPSETLAPARVAATPAAYPVERLVGSWGVASYREEKDRARTEAQARAHCKQPYVISKGPTDGVMMHVADDPTPHELTLKGGPGGKTYLGFEGPPGDEQDREILSMSDNIFVARFVSPEINARYGTLIYVRCNKARP
jgi:hypothetical protein